MAGPACAYVIEGSLLTRRHTRKWRTGMQMFTFSLPSTFLSSPEIQPMEQQYPYSRRSLSSASLFWKYPHRQAPTCASLLYHVSVAQSRSIRIKLLVTLALELASCPSTLPTPRDNLFISLWYCRTDGVVCMSTQVYNHSLPLKWSQTPLEKWSV